ncbi:MULTISPECIES: hypothetical protein [Pseudomonas]|uniref:hypothetical protein n=1 Tax=Pseudomonas TaxID=286 RepID=UPI00129C0393|nr:MULTISPECIES: hypothetical protein [Pseudomonas]MBH3459875.1 hypothetical protein [Pseudomonas putida]MBK0057065.1 hypothetical protein [Pseudomonas sp. S44]
MQQILQHATTLLIQPEHWPPRLAHWQDQLNHEVGEPNALFAAPRTAELANFIGMTASV